MQNQSQSNHTYETQVEREYMAQPCVQQFPWQAPIGQMQPWMPQAQAQPWGGQMQMSPMQQPMPTPFPQQAMQPSFPLQVPPMGMPVPRIPQVWEPGMLPMEMSYIENILRLNRGKRVKVYMTYENNPQWPALTYTGIVQEAGRDHIIISDPQTGKWYLLLMVNLDYIVFDEEIEYDYPFGHQVAPMAAYPPR